jgi:hypothetical protein
MPINEEIARKQFERYQYARDNGHLDFVDKADTCEDYFAGNQWDPVTRRKLENQGKPVLTINKVLATVAAVMGEQLENRADISFRPLKDGSQETADALTKLYIQIANANKLDWVESEVAADGFITSRGFYDVRAVFGDSMQGEAQIKKLNPRNVIVDPDAEDYDPDTWKEWFLTKWLSPDDIEILYSKADADILRLRQPDSLLADYDNVDKHHGTFGGEARTSDSSSTGSTVRRVRVIERQYKKLYNAWHFVDPETGDVSIVPDTWSEDKRIEVAAMAGLSLTRKLVERIRWTVTADNVVLFDEWSPYLSFTVVPYFPFFRNGKTIGIVENLLSPQDQLNKTSSQELHIINTTANSGYKVKTGSLQNMDIEDLEERGAQTGVVFELTDTKDLEKIQPNQVPTGLDRVAFKADQFIKEISGVSDSSRGFDRADVAAKAIEAKQAAGSVNLAKPMDNLARTRHLLAKRILDLIQTFYTEHRVLKITGTDLVTKTEELEINKPSAENGIVNDLTIGKYDVVVTTAPARNNFEETQFKEALELRQLGVAIPDDILVEASHLERKAEIAERIKELSGDQPGSQEEQAAAQLELQLKQLEIQEKEADIAVKQANAKATVIKASADVQQLGANDTRTADRQDKASAEAMRILAQLTANRETIAANKEMKQAELDLKREQIAIVTGKHQHLL